MVGAPLPWKSTRSAAQCAPWQAEFLQCVGGRSRSRRKYVTIYRTTKEITVDRNMWGMLTIGFTFMMMSSWGGGRDTSLRSWIGSSCTSCGCFGKSQQYADTGCSFQQKRNNFCYRRPWRSFCGTFRSRVTTCTYSQILELGNHSNGEQGIIIEIPKDTCLDYNNCRGNFVPSTVTKIKINSSWKASRNTSKNIQNSQTGSIESRLVSAFHPPCTHDTNSLSIIMEQLQSYRSTCPSFI